MKYLIFIVVSVLAAIILVTLLLSMIIPLSIYIIMLPIINKTKPKEKNKSSFISDILNNYIEKKQTKLTTK